MFTYIVSLEELFNSEWALRKYSKRAKWCPILIFVLESLAAAAEASIHPSIKFVIKRSSLASCERREALRHVAAGGDVIWESAVILPDSFQRLSETNLVIANLDRK